MEPNFIKKMSTFSPGNIKNSFHRFSVALSKLNNRTRSIVFIVVYGRMKRNDEPFFNMNSTYDDGEYLEHSFIYFFGLL